MKGSTCKNFSNISTLFDRILGDIVQLCQLSCFALRGYVKTRAEFRIRKVEFQLEWSNFELKKSCFELEKSGTEV